MRISILTLFPEMFVGPFDHSIIKKAKEKNLITVNFVNIRDFGIGKHKIVDDKPYGGGKGMILKVDVLAKAIDDTKDPRLSKRKQKVILLDARGKTFNQKKAISLSRLEHIILVCGHYEGVDERIRRYIDAEISIGDFIVTGGEIPAMLITDAVARLTGILKNEATQKESFSLPAGRQAPYLEYPQYTRPPMYEKAGIPKVLLSGNHKKIEQWQKENALKNTRQFRSDLLKKN